MTQTLAPHAPARCSGLVPLDEDPGTTQDMLERLCLPAGRFGVLLDELDKVSRARDPLIRLLPQRPDS